MFVQDNDDLQEFFASVLEDCFSILQVTSEVLKEFHQFDTLLSH